MRIKRGGTLDTVPGGRPHRSEHFAQSLFNCLDYYTVTMLDFVSSRDTTLLGLFFSFLGNTVFG